MNILIPVLLCLSTVVVSVYTVFVLLTLVVSEDFGERTSFKVSLVTPLFIIIIAAALAKENVFSDPKKLKIAFKMATIDYPIVLTMMIGIIQDHQWQVRKYGKSVYTWNKKSGSELSKTEKTKPWLKSIPNIKNLIFSDEFKNDIKENWKLA